MADYFSPTVIQPTIPIADMTPLERLIFSHVFDTEPDGEGLYFFTELGPRDSIELDAQELRYAIQVSAGIDSEALTYVSGQLGRIDEGDAFVTLDLSGTSWEFFFQNVVRRSQTLQHVTAVTAFTCSKMRPDGFGGMAVVITADAIRGKDTDDILDDLLDDVAQDPVAVAPGYGGHVLLRLSERNVRAVIAQVTEADETLAASAAAVTDADIRVACRAIAASDFSEERGAMEFKAALAAIREAERRLASGG